MAHVIPIHKKENTKDLTNYRQISLLSITGTLFERCVYNFIYECFEKFNIICENQSGFRPVGFTVNQLINITNDVGKALDSGKEIRVVFCDISKTFDRVLHRGLPYKLANAGISGSLLK